MNLGSLTAFDLAMFKIGDETGLSHPLYNTIAIVTKRAKSWRPIVNVTCMYVNKRRE